MIKSTLKFAVLAIGAVAFIFGTSSCKKDDDKSCCTMTYEGETDKICEGDEYNGVTLSGDAWDLLKSYLENEEGVTCN